jgi:hypothetical protein
MKKILAIVLMAVLCMSIIPMAAFAAEPSYTRGEWVVDGSTYKSPNMDYGNSFTTYQLGSSDKVTITATVTIGQEHGFMVGMKDMNGDNLIDENADQYYLIDIMGSGAIGIERNDKNWGDWSFVSSELSGTVTLTIVYDNGAICVKNGDQVVASYKDANPMGGTGYALISKRCEATFTNVSVAHKADAFAPGGTTEGAMGGEWSVDGTNYVNNARVNWPDFAYYCLGNSTNELVVLSATVTVGHSDNEEWKNGSDVGFIFGASDNNANGTLNERGDGYYLVALTGANDGPTVSIERNRGEWGGWQNRRWDLGFYAGDKVDFVAAYDPAAGKITTWVNGYKASEQTYSNQLPGTGFGLASKQTGAIFENVKVSNTLPAGLTDCMQISTADELIALANAANKWNYNAEGGEEHGANFMFGMTVELAADIDMTGKDWTPIKKMKFGIDGKGHTISGLNVTVEETAGGNYGLLANELSNNGFNAFIKNVVIKDSTLTVKSTSDNAYNVKVGAVAGFGDRGFASDVTLSDVTINVEGKAYVGGLIGVREWAAGAERENGVNDVKFEYTTINAPEANVGLVYGYVGSDCNDVTISEVSGKVYVVSANEVTSDTLIAENKSNMSTADTAKGVEILDAPEEKPVTPPPTEEDPVPTGDAMIIGTAILSVVALAGVVVFSKKRHV